MKFPPRLVRTSAAVAATAVIGVLGTDVTSRWYRNLDKPAWQPPGAAFGANLMLNAGWNWLFFTARRPRWALAEILLMEASALDLTRRAAQVDRGAAKMLIPYAGWVAFATALNASIAARNPKGHP